MPSSNSDPLIVERVLMRASLMHADGRDNLELASVSFVQNEG
jgi:hypothetical protein